MKGLLQLLPIVAITLVFWLLVIRPGARRQRELRAMQADLAVGDRVVLTSGIFGTIRALHEDRADIEISTGVTITVARGAVAGPEPTTGHVTEPVTEPVVESGSATGPDLRKRHDTTYDTTHDTVTSPTPESEES